VAARWPPGGPPEIAQGDPRLLDASPSASPAPPAEPAPPPVEKPPFWRRPGGIAGVALEVAAVVAVAVGAALLSLDGSCPGGTNGSLCASRYHTGLGGGVTLGAGLLSAAAGAILLIGRY
jgi:hypothetical protein